MNSKLKKIITVAVILIVGMAIHLAIIIQDRNSEQSPKVGLILSGAKDESGWNGMHYEGLKSACERADVQLLVKENVKEFSGKCEESLKELIKDEAGMIILSSYGYSEEIADIVSEYPDVAFYANSSERHDKNMTSYFVKMYQARYLSGVLAGMRTENNKIGYVAAMPNNEVNRGISAFTLGVRSVNEDAEVIVIWSGSWDDSRKETECTKTLIEKCNIDVVTYHQNGHSVIDTAEQYGIDSIGYHQHYDMYSEHYLTSVVCRWDKVYSELIKEFLSGKTNSKENLWLGIEKEAVGLSDLSKNVTEDEKKAIEQAKEKLMSGHEVFSGLIYDINGQIQCNEGEIISDEELLEDFDWYVQGVKLYEE